MKNIFKKIIIFSLNLGNISFSFSGILKYFKNIQWLTLARFGVMLFSFITTIVIARVFGPEKFGILSYVLSTVGLFGIIASLGIENSVYKELTLHKEDRNIILGSGILLKIFTGFIAISAVIFYVLLSEESPYMKGLMISSSLIFITQPLILLAYDFLKDAESKYVAIAQISTGFFAGVTKILIVYLYESVFYIILILSIENVITGIILWFAISKIKKRDLIFTFSKKYAKKIFSASIPLTLYSASEALYSKIDQVMIGKLLNLESVGLYSSAVRLTEIWYFIPNIIIGALFPAFIHTSDNKEEYRKRLNFTFLILLIIALLVAFGTLIFGKIMIQIIFGNSFIEASSVLFIYIFSLVGSYFSFLIYQDLFISSKMSAIVFISFICAISNIYLNYIWIPLFGIHGAALATLVSYSLIPVLYWLYKKYGTK